MAANIELKARLRDYDSALQVARRAADRGPEELHQVDVYFRVPQGRLKLRTINGGMSELIGYRRGDDSAARRSDYIRHPVAEPVTLRAALAATCGEWLVVEKQRTVYFSGPVRIHLDRVVGLGDHLEFEAVLSDDFDEAAGYSRVEELKCEFGLGDADLTAGSYSDLLMVAAQG